MSGHAFSAAAEHVAHGLLRNGVRPGQAVAFLARNSPEYLPTALGIMSTGAVVAPINPAFLPGEIAAQLRGSKAAFLLATADTAAAARALDPTLSLRRLLVDGTFDLTPLDSEADPMARAWQGEAGDALLAWSVGPGGFPAAVRHTHASLVGAVTGLAAVAPWRDDDVVLSVISPYDLYGFVSTLALALHLGVPVVTARRFEATTFADMARRFGATLTNAVPTIVHALAEAPPELVDLGSLRLVISGGAPLAPHVAAAFRARYGVAVVQGYGLAEAAGATHVDVPVQTADVVTCGRPILGIETQIVGPDGNAVAIGMAGELWLRGTQVFSGYLGQPAKTSTVLAGDGWLRTGDLVREDDRGRLIVLGRLKRVVKVNAYQVSPDEVEAALRGHPAVVDASVIPAWSPDTGEESVETYAVLRDAVEQADVLAWAGARLARHKRPRELRIVEQLPSADGPWMLPWASQGRRAPIAG